MQKLGLKAKERAEFEKALRSSHTRRVEVSVTNLQGAVLGRISPVLLDGQVTVDRAADVSRTASLTFLDPHHSLSFDTNSPDDAALYADRMIRVDYIVSVPALDREVETTVFLGPVTKLDRAGDVVTVEAQGKEALASGAIWRPLTLKKGTRMTAGIRTLMRDRAGERQLQIPNANARIPKARSLDRFSSIWSHARKLASGLNRQLFYDGAGTLILRNPPNSPVYTFRDEDGGDVVSDVQVSYEMENVKNTVLVIGAKPKGAKSRVRARAIAPRNHALSPWRLGRSGGPRYLVEVIEDSAIRTKKEAQAKANQVLKNRLRETVQVTFDALPVPHLDPGDLVRIRTASFSTTFRLGQFTIPLTPTGSPTMSVGYLKRTVPNRKRIRR